MKKILFSLALALFAAEVFADPELPEGKWWKKPRIAAEIGLSSDQAREIEAIFVRSRGKLIDLRAELQKKQAELQDAMEDESADRGAVASKIEAVEDARAGLQKTRALMFLDMKRVLRTEQWERLREMQEEARRLREERLRQFRQREQMEERGAAEKSPERRQESNRSRPDPERN